MRGWEVQGEVNADREPRLPWLVPGRYVHTRVFMYMCINARLDISFLSCFPLISHIWLLYACVRVFVHHSSNLSHRLTSGVFMELCWVSLYTWTHLRLTTRQTRCNTLDVAVIRTATHTHTWLNNRATLDSYTQCHMLGLPPFPFFCVTPLAA